MWRMGIAGMQPDLCLGAWGYNWRLGSKCVTEWYGCTVRGALISGPSSKAASEPLHFNLAFGGCGVGMGTMARMGFLAVATIHADFDRCGKRDRKSK
jgi:hypothetical protein